MKTFIEHFVSSLTSLKTKDLEKILDTKIVDSKFLKIDYTDAEYGFVWYDDNEGEYAVSKVYLYTTGKDIKIEKISPMPEELFSKESDAKAFLKRMK